MHKFFGILFAVFLIPNAYGQVFEGRFVDSAGIGLPTVRIVWLMPENRGIGGGFYTDSIGRYNFSVPNKATRLEVIAGGPAYVSDTLFLEAGVPQIHRLKREHLDAFNLEEQRLRSSMSLVNTVPTEHIGAGELRRAACCNLSESFETNATVDVGFTDAVTGAKTIQMLGLDGRYVSITTELLPSLRGLATGLGLDFVPGPWMESIQISKGVGSAVNGFESMSGQINLELQKPETAPNWYVNVYGNHMGRLEASVHKAIRINPRWSNLTMATGSYFDEAIDANNDSFLDMPKKRSVGILHRWKYNGKNMESQFGVRFFGHRIEGGNVQALSPGIPGAAFPVGMRTYRGEAFAKTGFFFKNKPYKSLGLMTSFTFHNQSGGFGINSYTGKENTLYFNGIYQSIIGDTRYTWKAGASFLWDEVQENFVGFNPQRSELVPGGFGEITLKPNGIWEFVLGGRIDYHNLFGWYPQPRAHLKASPRENLAFRLSGGRAFRTPNYFADRLGVLTTSRLITIDPNLKPEESWSAGGGIQWSPRLFGREAQFSADIFRTWIDRQMVANRETPGHLSIEMHEQAAWSQAIQLNAAMFPVERLELRLSYKWQEVYSTFGNQTLRMPLVPEQRGLASLGYEIKSWGLFFDFTTQLIGPSRLPELNDPELNRPLRSDWYVLFLGQIRKELGIFEVYIGGENLGNFTQDNPIVQPNDPYNSNFDAGFIWAPVFGRMIYVGVHIEPGKKRK